ncbi:unnamed protein product [Effrenium voratum]|nr:unnamed protein product [Effrenium voratum]
MVNATGPYFAAGGQLQLHQAAGTLAAESNAFLMGVEAADYINSIFQEMINPGNLLNTLETEYAKRGVYAFTDAKSVESTITKDTGQPSDKRAMENCTWRLLPTEEAVAQKEAIRVGRRRRKAEKKPSVAVTPEDGQHEQLVTAIEKGRMDLADLAYKAGFHVQDGVRGAALVP